MKVVERAVRLYHKVQTRYKLAFVDHQVYQISLNLKFATLLVRDNAHVLRNWGHLFVRVFRLKSLLEVFLALFLIGHVLHRSGAGFVPVFVNLVKIGH